MKTFPRQREDYSPYGFTCELWYPPLTPCFDHHNEIEINFIARGSLEYFFHDRTITLPEGTVALFWAFLPHRITGFTEGSRYYVITVPLATFLEWNLSENFLKSLFSGLVITDSDRPAAESITQIAYLSGFSTVSNFNITFKRITGHPPRDYRRLLRR